MRSSDMAVIESKLTFPQRLEHTILAARIVLAGWVTL